MDGAVQAAHRRCDTLGSGSQYSFRTSVSSVAEIPSEVEEVSPPPPPPAEEDKVFVAVAADVKHGKSTLQWALQNLAKDGAKVVIAHVHSPAQMIPMMGAKVHYTKMNPKQVSDYRNNEREKAEEKLDEYLLICRKLKVSCEKLIIEEEDIAKGLEDLIALNGITKLVMAAAADKHYSRKMNTPKSKTALKILEVADPSCKIWFTCKGHLICTREANTTVPAIPPSPAHTIASTLSSSSITSRMRSMTMNPSESEASSSSGSPRHDLNRSRTEVARYPSQGCGTTPSQLFEHSNQNINDGPTRTAIGSIDSWDEFGRPQNSWYNSSRNSDAVRVPGSAMQQPMYEPEDDHFASPRELENSGDDADIYSRLQEALREAQGLKKETYEESTRRRNAERNLISALQKVKELESLYQKEIMHRKITEEALEKQTQETEEKKEALEKQIQETEETKRQYNAIHDKLHDVQEHKLMVEHRMTEMQAVLKEHEERLAESKHLLLVLQADKERLQQERDAAVSEAQDLRWKNKQRIPMPGEDLSTEFSAYELEQATRGFDKELKIGEGGFGSVYKGTLRNTTVAIKMLHPMSMQGQSEFDQEVAVLSRVRHPNLVTLIGACREAFGLVYEFLPNGSLEDCLACLNNTPPLTWQVRTKIIYEMCSALTFLHSNKPHPVVHGDLKPANILLDANFVSKLGDFGICRLLIKSNTTAAAAAATTTMYRTTTPKGTFAYMDPEFLTTGELTPRSDVYSLGIIILRLLTGKPPQKIAEVVEDAIESGELHSILDPSAGSWPFVQANQLAHLGLRCAEMSRRRRPDLTGDVWKVIEPLMKAASLTAGRPSFVARPDDAPPPSYFVCPIFQEEMNDPHIAADGFTYEAEAIRGWLDSGHDRSPMTNLRLDHRELIPNRALRSAILEWQQQQQRQRHPQQQED
ncbi:U-box domain-containing protein 33-like isoform X1 [Oryza brachyantha]|uniref:U-box domain-containing protein 33-like isoform X1 n=2 Tax=Oryza brachyantha TaxID=4533 RepID=UPI001ADB940C|nr:U-box domain-containing protein 33-like isoform X1 [Oryza brachyantha]